MRGSLEACPGWRSATRWVFGLDSMTPRAGGPAGRRAGSRSRFTDSSGDYRARADLEPTRADMPNAMLTAPPSERFLAVDGRLEKRALGAATSQHDSPNSATRAASHRRPASTNTALAQLMAH